MKRELTKSVNLGIESIVTTNEHGTTTNIEPKSHSIRQRQHAFLMALEKTMGNISLAAKLTNIARDSHYDWLAKYPKYKEKANTIKNITLEFVESKMMQRIGEGSDNMIQFYLRTQAKETYKDDGQLLPQTPVSVNIHPKVVDQLPAEG